MGFSRQGYWSGLPFPSPGDLPEPGIELSPALQADSLLTELPDGVGSLSLLQGNLPNPGIKPKFPTLQADSLPVEPPGKPTNTGVGSLSLLQGIFPTQESNWGLLHYRWILYHLSYQTPHQILLSWILSFGRHERAVSPFAWQNN